MHRRKYVGSGIGVWDVCEGSGATGSRCSVSVVVGVAGSVWSVGMGSGLGVGSGVGSGGTFSLVVGIGVGFGSVGCGVLSVVGVSSEVGSSAGVVDCGSSWALGIGSCTDGGLDSLSRSSTVSM